jgi:hypothetical protein
MDVLGIGPFLIVKPGTQVEMIATSSRARKEII